MVLIRLISDFSVWRLYSQLVVSSFHVLEQGHFLAVSVGTIQTSGSRLPYKRGMDWSLYESGPMYRGIRDMAVLSDKLVSFNYLL